MKIEQYLLQNSLDYSIIEQDLLFSIKDVGIFLIISPKNDLLFDNQFKLILNDIEIELAENVDYFCFYFGCRWYYYNKNDEPSLIPLKYLGKAII